MFVIEELRDHVQRKFPGARLELTPPLRPDGIWSLEVDLVEKNLSVEWSPTRGFGISSARHDTYGENPDEVYSTLERARNRLDRLLTSDDQTLPPVGVLMARVRENRGLTQAELARRMGVSQATVSGIERRSDVQFGTVHRIVDALGGRLELAVVFESARYQILPSGASATNCANEPNAPHAATKFLSGANFTGLASSGALPAAYMIAETIRNRHQVLEIP
jgi:transcriptional regulator with XRE-family HTH domain